MSGTLKAELLIDRSPFEDPFRPSVTWSGKGDVQSVTLAEWEKMKRHPDVWTLVERAPAPKPAAKPVFEPSPEPVATLGDAVAGNDEVAALRELAKAKGVAVHHKITDPDKIRALIAAAEDAVA